ncbi:hypothetical protein [Ochrobactrum sp. A-1]|uniref:hypothetical protein n=1 Tax=Ochrobactrum sp. A-1 TaxID=2920940 RepID=UPI001F0A3EDD|nr:hypothetical protein [Ochrobactrum sp. A-1]
MMQVLILAFLKRHLAAFVLIGSILLIGSFVYLKGVVGSRRPGQGSRPGAPDQSSYQSGEDQ